MTDLLVIGGVALDYLSKVKDASAQVTQVTEYSQNIGGMAYNTAITTAQLGIGTRLVAAVGNDFPKLPEYKDLQFDFTEVYGPTTRSFLFFDEKKEERIFFFPGTYHDINVEDAKNAIRRVKWVHFAGVVPCFAELITFAEEENKIVSANPGYDLFHYDPQDKIIKTIIEKSDYLIVSEKEAKHLNRPIDNLINEAVIVTMGKNGSVIAEKGKKTQIDAFTVEVESPFGAGDTYAGTFIAAMLLENDIIKSTRLASAAASYAVEEKTTTPDLDWDKIKKRAKKL